MGRLLNEKNFINNNIFDFEQRLDSQYSVFLEGNPTYVNYYHINNIESITDSGWMNVEKILGENSPLKFQEIKDLPLYGIENIQLDLADEEEGLTNSYEGTATILPNTVKPLPNDLFTISYLGKKFLFMITKMEWDTIRSHGFYKIDFYLKSVSEESVEQLQKQVSEKYNCIFANIGTEDKCLIKEDEFYKLEELMVTYRELIQKYKLLYYNKYYNSFIYKNRVDDTMVYDKYLNHFISESNILRDDYTYDTISLSNEDYNDFFEYEFGFSIYDSILRKSKDNIQKHIGYDLKDITNYTSIFHYYGIDNVRSVSFNEFSINQYLPSELLISIVDDLPTGHNVFFKLISNYFNNKIETIYELPLEELKNYKLEFNFKEYILIPIILFILRYYRKELLRIAN